MKRVSIVLAAVAAVACGGPGPNNDGDLEPTLSSIQKQIFELPAANCSGCHREPGNLAQPTTVNLLAGAAHASLVDQPATSPAWNGTQWEGLKLVEPGNPEQSALYLVLAQPPDLPSALRMPNGAKLNAARIEAVKTWIQNGALDD